MFKQQNVFMSQFTIKYEAEALGVTLILSNENNRSYFLKICVQNIIL